MRFQTRMVPAGELQAGDRDQNGQPYEILSQTLRMITFKNSVGTYTVRKTKLLNVAVGDAVLPDGSDLEHRSIVKFFEHNDKRGF